MQEREREREREREEKRRQASCGPDARKLEVGKAEEDAKAQPRDLSSEQLTQRRTML
jgi:hypothetical protein